MKKELTNEENDLIEAIRNCKKAYPNGWPQLEAYARELFEELLIK